MSLTRREFLTALAAAAATPSLAAEAPAGTARYLVEMLVFRQPGPAPVAMPVAPLPIITPIPGRIETLPESAWQLTGFEQAILRHGDYPVLAHTAWAALVPPNGRTTARLEDVLKEGAPLAGSVGLQRGQYLFLGVDVDYLAEPGISYGLREKRRVKFGERHYFDHPAFGVIAQVVPSRGGTAAD
ncbi:MAG TPA: CsiV family protein [Steroidobacteraceae bacterium]|nr:CsiV family protein [Steroidobacteraceae bacterium]